jgi:hypothetical protein
MRLFKKHNDRLHGRDRAKLQRIREGGADLSHPLEITHRLSFEIEDGRGQADTAAARLRDHGYTVSVEYSRRYAPVSPSSRGPSQAGASSRKSDPGVWEVTASRVAVLDPPEINATVAEVSGVAEEFGGLYWRWEAHLPAT